ncbi:type II secretion system protein XpsH [Coralloluteibacterium stylophorae]|uniref:Type II secretion system protein H n=1 Tax=Coralloluteibacterium stylophorae TaxID=1776034 RepID=A0A8J7VU20_9GAMM|nr:GspH/FimT family pseudopilin [Coralloluteibacterium stylophorae]MBS7457779.1 GspH/FimT family pseudopilin [Coralloluteibacterium stylophorae]
MPRRLCSSDPARGAERVRGFTLLEIVVVIALVAVITTTLAVSLTGGLDGMRVRTAVKEVAAQLRFARARAIVSGQAQDFVVDPQARRWQGAEGRSGELPDGFDIVATGAREVQPTEGVAAIRFFPDGSATGGRIELVRGEARWRIDIAWLTGEVRLAAAAGDDA